MEAEPALANRIRGALLGSACANSLGATCLGMTRREIMVALGLRGLKEYTGPLSRSLMRDYQPGSLLPDSVVALSLAESLVSHGGKLEEDDLKNRFAGLLEDREFVLACPRAHYLLELRQAVNPSPAGEDECGEDVHVSIAARAFPIGLLPGRESVAALAAAQAGLSHADRRLWAASAVLAHSVSLFLQGLRLDSESRVRDYVRTEFDVAAGIDERFAEFWDDVAPDLDYMHPATELPYSLINVDSHVNEAMPTAFGIFLIFRHDFEGAVEAAATAGGNTDTVAAIVGALAGAYHGAEAIPERWLNGLSHRDRIEKVADGLIGLWRSAEQN